MNTTLWLLFLATALVVNVLAQSRTPVTVIFGVSPDIAVPAGAPAPGQSH